MRVLAVLFALVGLCCAISVRDDASCPDMSIPCNNAKTRDATKVKDRSVNLMITILGDDDDSNCQNKAAEVDQIYSQIEITAAQFAPAKISFNYYSRYLCNTALNRNGGNDDDALLTALSEYAVDPSVFLEWFIPTESQNYGYGHFPWINPPAMLLIRGAALGTSLSMGDTAAHETGHAFGLYHPFDNTPSSCSDFMIKPCTRVCDSNVTSLDTTGDLCSDTPPEYTPPVSPGTGPLCKKGSACDPGEHDVDCNGNPFPEPDCHNVMGNMDYCQPRTFTPQQVARMHCFLTNSLPTGLTSAAPDKYDQYAFAYWDTEYDDDSSAKPTWGIALIVIVALLIVIVLFLTVAVIFLLVKSKKGHNSSETRPLARD